MKYCGVSGRSGIGGGCSLGFNGFFYKLISDIPPPSRLKCVFPENSLPHPQSEHSTGLNTNGSCGGTFIRTSDFGCERVWIMNFRAISCLSWQKNRATKNTKIHKKILSRQYLPPVPGTRTDHSPKSPPHTARRPLCRFICQFRVRDAEWRLPPSAFRHLPSAFRLACRLRYLT
jgi:hypothetical protein